MTRMIADFIHGRNDNKIIKDKIASAMANGINEKITINKMKMTLAGLLSYFTMKAGRYLKESELRDLFYAIVRDKGQSDIDTDIPARPESFAKAIQRERRNWKNAFNDSRNFT